MKLNSLILLTFALFLQSAEASKKKKGGSRLGRIFINTCQICQFAALPRPNLSPYQQGANTVNTSVELYQDYAYRKEDCQFALEPATDKAMEYLICGNKIQTKFFMDKILTDVDNEKKQGLLLKSTCPKLLQLWHRVKDRVCTPVMKNLERIVNGAMKRILGRENSTEENINMFEEQLVNLKDVPETEVEELKEKFENLKNPDFFLIIRATDYFKEHERLSTLDALKEAMKEKNQGIDFDHVDRALSEIRNIEKPSNLREWWYLDHQHQLKTAKEGPLKELDFDTLDVVAANLEEYSLSNRQSKEILTDPKNQDMDWKKVIAMIPIAIAEKDLTREQRIKMIFDRSHQYNDPLRYRKMHQLLEKLAPNNLEIRKLSRENWVQCNDWDFDKVNEVYRYCRDQLHRLACYKLKVAPFRKQGKVCPRGYKKAALTSNGNDSEKKEKKSDADL